MPMDQMWQTMSLGMSLGMLLVWVLLVAVIVAGIVVVVRAVHSRSGTDQDRNHAGALQILEERFARGDIDRDEFEERRRAITS